MALNMERGKSYSFISVNDGVLNQTFTNVRVTSGKLGFKLANLVLNVGSRHAMLWPYIQNKEDYSIDPSKLEYFTIEFPNGLETVMCDAWINHDSVREVQPIRKTLDFMLDSQSQYDELLNLLKINGIKYKVL